VPASGIGRATALAFAREGADVVVADIAEQDNQDTAHMIQQAGGQTLVVQCDVTRSGDVQAALTKLVDEFGHLDVAFNNAVAEQERKATADVTEEEWDRILAVNLRGVFLSMKYEMQRFTGGTPEGRDRVIGQESVGRMATSEEIAATVLWLCSDAASFVVGHAMVVDGGQTV
jgi:NAD(P)-dependent dehydrogenase (short-subunit alcohol dehydrogenase family)